MTTCRRFYRECPEFNICVNIGKKDYVLAEDPQERYTIFQYGIEGIGKFGRIFESDYITFEGGKFYDVREYVHDNVVFHAQEDFFLIGFNTKDKSQGWEGRLLTETELDVTSHKPEIKYNRHFIICFDGKPVVNGKKLKRYDYSEVYPNKKYNIEYDLGVIGLFTKL